MILCFLDALGDGLLIIGVIAVFILFGLFLLKIFVFGGAIAVGVIDSLCSSVIQFMKEYVCNSRIRESDVIDYPKGSSYGVIKIHLFI